MLATSVGGEAQAHQSRVRQSGKFKAAGRHIERSADGVRKPRAGRLRLLESSPYAMMRLTAAPVRAFFLGPAGSGLSRPCTKCRLS